MKKLILAAVAASVVTTPVLAAPFGQDNRGRIEFNQHGDQRGDFRGPRQFRNQQQFRGWQRGDRFDSRYAQDYRVVNNYRNYRLAPPPRGYRWVQSGNDAVLVGIASGLIGAIIGGALN